MKRNSGDEARRRRERAGDPLRVFADKVRLGRAGIKEARAAFEALLAAGAPLRSFRTLVEDQLGESDPLAPGHSPASYLRITREAAERTWPWVELLMDVLDTLEPTDEWPLAGIPGTSDRVQEGWDVFWSDGSVWAPYQIQKFDDRSGEETYEIIEEREAWQHACAHAALGHKIGLDALRFLRRWARNEYELVVGVGGFGPNRDMVDAYGPVHDRLAARERDSITTPLCFDCLRREVEIPGTLCALCADRG